MDNRLRFQGEYYPAGNATAFFDYAGFAPTHALLTGDFAKNFGFNQNAIKPKTNAWQARLDLGRADMRRLRDWSLYFAYRYLERGADGACTVREDRPPAPEGSQPWQTMKVLPWLSVLLALLLPPDAHAEAPKQDAAIQQVLRKAQGALRQLSEEKAKLEEKAAKLEAQARQARPQKPAGDADEE
ncbi:hypothetical protein MYXO_03386 [Myxococcaceae bacterium]|nr:hypothetical protein MYXO_03386 [Myxococcaceae bacterium]